MTREMILAQIKSLETQLAILRAEVERLERPTPSRSFGNLYGLLAGKVSTSEEEMEAVRYRFRWEGKEER